MWFFDVPCKCRRLHQQASVKLSAKFTRTSQNSYSDMLHGVMLQIGVSQQAFNHPLGSDRLLSGSFRQRLVTDGGQEMTDRAVKTALRQRSLPAGCRLFQHAL